MNDTFGSKLVEKLHCPLQIDRALALSREVRIRLISVRMRDFNSALRAALRFDVRARFFCRLVLCHEAFLRCCEGPVADLSHQGIEK